MSVKTRPYVNGGWEVDIRFRLPDGTEVRERTKSPVSGKSASQRWAEDRERVLLLRGKPRPRAEREVKPVTTLNEFAPRFLDGYARANRQKPSGVASKETILRVHLGRHLGEKPLDQITTEDVQRLKAELRGRAPKTVNNVLTVLSVALKTAVAWGVINRVPCTIELVKTTARAATFLDFAAYERLMIAARADGALATAVVLLGGDAGLRCGEMMALGWEDVNLAQRQLAVTRIRVEGPHDRPEGRSGAIYILADGSADRRATRHAASPERARARGQRRPGLTQKVVQGIVRRVARKAGVQSACTWTSHLLLASGDAGRARAGD